MMNSSNNIRITEQKEPELTLASDINRLQSDKNLIGVQQRTVISQQQPIAVLDKNVIVEQQPIAVLEKNVIVAPQDKNILASQVNGLLDKNMSQSTLSQSQLDSQLNAEIVNHPPLHHTRIVNDCSAPVLPPTANLSTPSTTDKIATTLAGVKDAAAAKVSQVAADVSAAATNLQIAAADKIQEMKQEAIPAPVPHFIQPDLKQELVQHAPLNHTTIESDHSAPVVSVPTDHNQPSIHLADIKDIAVAKAAPIASKLSAGLSSLASSISSTVAETAANLKAASAAKIAELKKQQEEEKKKKEAEQAFLNSPHYVQPALKEELIHHAPLHHNTIVNDHSAPVLSVPTDHNIAPQPTLASSLADIKTIAAVKAAPLAASLSAAASSAASSVASSATQLKQAAAEKISSIGHKEQVVTEHHIQPALKEELIHHAPLHHVSDVSGDHSAPVLSAPTDSISSHPIQTNTSSASGLSSVAASLKHAGELVQAKATEAYHSVLPSSTQSTTVKAGNSPLRETVRHPVPQHPDIVLHPGPINLSNVHSTLPSNLKETNQLAGQTFESKQLEVHNGGVAWAVPLEGAAAVDSSASVSSAPVASVSAVPVVAVVPVVAAALPQTISSISTGPNSITYSTLSTTPSTITYTTTTKSVETIPAADLNQRL